MPISEAVVSFDIINQYTQPPAETSKLSKKRRKLGVTKSWLDFVSIFLAFESVGELSLFKVVYPVFLIQ